MHVIQGVYIPSSCVYSLTDNVELLKRRLKSLEDSREQLDRSLKEQISYNRTLEREMHKLKPDLLSLVRQRDKHSMYVNESINSVRYAFHLELWFYKFYPRISGG